VKVACSSKRPNARLTQCSATLPDQNVKDASGWGNDAQGIETKHPFCSGMRMCHRWRNHRQAEAGVDPGPTRAPRVNIRAAQLRSVYLSSRSSQHVSTSKQSDSVVMQQGWHSPPPRMEPEQWSTHAVPLVLSMLSALKLDGSRYFGQAEFLPRMLFRQSEEAPLTLCCKALGLSFLANKPRMDKANTIRDRAYGQALAAANGLVSDPNLCRGDETPVSVWLLSLYEVSNAPCCTDSENLLKSPQIVTGAHSPTTVTIPAITWSIHTQGLLELMRLRGPEQLQTYTGRNIFWLLAPSVQIRSLIAGIECPSFIKTWLDDLLGRNQTINADLVRLNSFAHTTALLSAIMCRTLRGSSPELLGWEIDSIWNRVQATGALFHEAMDDNLLGETISLDKIHYCNTYRVYYMRTLQFMLDLAHTAFLQPEAAVDHNQISAITTHGTINIRSLAAETVRTIPYFLCAGVIKLNVSYICPTTSNGSSCVLG